VQATKKKKPAKQGSRAGRGAKGKKAENHAVALGVGARLKAVREQTGLSQRELARRAGVTNVTISLIEQENHAPSLASLHRILTAIPISMADFFALPTTKQDVLFYEHDDLAVVVRGTADLRVLGAERRDKKLQLFFERYAPGASTGESAIVHDGETAAVVVQGSVELEVGGQRRRINAGGGFQLLGKQPYRLTNVGRQTAVVVCACTPSLV
jgi:transcriptional regulator with XRE-family HTH domain